MQIEIKQLKIMACHGCHAEEKIHPQPFVFDVFLRTDGARKDDVENTVSYSDVMKFVVSYAKERTFNLIETLSDSLAQEILMRFPLAKEVTVRVEKPNAPVPLDFQTVAVTAMRRWHTAYIALGSNLGERRELLDGAISALRGEGVRVEKVSSYIETEPYGGVATLPFLNGAAKISTFLSPEELLSVLQSVEARFGRTREVHWGNRTLDLDLLLYEDAVMETDRLILPHPEMTKRRFVMEPLCEIAPRAYHPVMRKIASEILRELE